MAEIVIRDDAESGQTEYEVSYGATDGEAQVTIGEASLSALATELGADYIAQGEIEEVISDMAAASGKEIASSEQLAFAQTMVERAVAARGEEEAGFTVETCGADFGCVYAGEEVAAMKTAASSRQESEGADAAYTLELTTPYLDLSITTTCSAAVALLEQVATHGESALAAEATHTSAIAALTSVAEVVAYDYSVGWPERLKASPDPS